MNLNNFTNYILYNEDLDNINLNNLGFPISFILNNSSLFNLNSITLDSHENSDNKSDISIGHLTNIGINSSDNNNNNREYFKSEERSEKSINLKKEKISNDSTIFTKGIYDNYSKQIIYEAMNEPKKKYNKIKSKSSNLFTQKPQKHRKKKKNIFSRKENSDNIKKK